MSKYRIPVHILTSAVSINHTYKLTHSIATNNQGSVVFPEIGRYLRRDQLRFVGDPLNISLKVLSAVVVHPLDPTPPKKENFGKNRLF